MKTKKLFLATTCAAMLTGFSSLSFAGANIVINNVDLPGVGFNDPTPATPVGGNIGITVGEQRLIAYQFALDLWGARLNSEPTIVVQGSFAGLNCDATGGTLAQAGALQIFADFANAPLPGTLYGAALANSIAGEDIFAEMMGIPPGEPDPGPLQPPFNDEIVANFNGNIGQEGCLEDSFWYYGLDNTPPENGIDFLNTFMHEVGHGLGFQNFANVTTGALAGGMQDVYTTLSFDNSIGLTHAEMTDEQRVQSFVNTGNVVWIGENVSAQAPNILDDRQFLEITQPETLAGEVDFGFANFGPSPSPENLDGQVAIAIDEGGASITDGCEPLVNGADVEGKIALIDRGSCSFADKAQNAQDAGAVGVLIANNAGGAIALGGTNANIVIPAVGISQEDGALIREEADNGVFIRVAIDPTRLAGADDLNRVRLNAPNPVQPGSSISHYDTAAIPNLLMEPAITDTLQAATDVDLTDDLFADIGWSVNFDADIPATSSDCNVGYPRRRVAIMGCPTFVKNRKVANVCRLSDVVNKQIGICLDSSEDLRSGIKCSKQALSDIRDLGLISDRERYGLKGCAVVSNVRHFLKKKW